MESAPTGRRASRGVVAALLLVALTFASARSESWRVPGGVLGAALSAVLVQVAPPALVAGVVVASAGAMTATGTGAGDAFGALLRTQLPGITMGALVLQGCSPLLAILGGAVPLFAPELAQLVASGGANLVSTDSTVVNELVAAVLESYRKLSIPEERLAESERLLRDTAYLVLSIAPALRFIGLLGIFLMIYLICQSIFSRLGFTIRPVGQFPLWRLSHWYAWVFAIGLIFLLLPDEALRVAGRNVIVVMAAAYFVQGLSVTQFLMIKRRLGFAMRMLIYSTAVVAIFPFFAAMTTGIGLFDTWFDFRGLEPRESPAEEERERASEDED